ELADLGRRRRVSEGLVAATKAVEDTTVKLSDAIGIADEAIGEKAITTIRESDAGDCFDDMFAGYEAEDRGITCKIIPTLDHLMGSLKPGSFNVMAGRPGMGKSAVAFSYSRGVAEQGHGTLLVSLEMPGDQIAQRMAADLCYDEHQVEYWAIRDGRLSSQEMALVRDAQARVRSMPLRVACGSALAVGRLAALIRRTARRFAAHGNSLDLVVIDYLQLLRPDMRITNRYEVITEISMALKAMALENDVAILALAQLSRAVEQREDKRPMLSDLKESGQLEQDADSVTFLLRQQYYMQKEEPPKENEKYVEWQSALAACRDKIEFIVAKRRNGVEGSGTASFYGKYQAVRG
ncbi:MAG: DnaB-like helicase C-terminal domain-containing protein, partial [Pseudomonadota bacterium]